MSRVALDQSLIDSVHTADEVIDILRTRMGWKSATEERLLDYRLYLEAAETVPSGKRVAVVTIEGEIKDGGDGPGMTGERDAVQRIRAVRESPDYAALVVRIDSPAAVRLRLNSFAVNSNLSRRLASLWWQASVITPQAAAIGSPWVPTRL